MTNERDLIQVLRTLPVAVCITAQTATPGNAWTVLAPRRLSWLPCLLA